MRQFLIWYTGGLIAAIVIGWLAALLHAAGVAPIGFVSFGIGAALGTALCVLAASRAPRLAVVVLVGHAPLVIGSIVLALLTILAEHAWLYLEFRQQWHAARGRSAEAAIFRSEAPWSPGEYFAREIASGRAPLWALDATLIIVAAVTTVLIAPRYFVNSRVAITPRERES
jgi:hypothetical protein